jgi:beta-mannosidase
MAERIDLNGKDWTFKGYYGQDWALRKAYLPNTPDRRWWRQGSVPGSVLDDLWRLGEVPNPYEGLNSLACEWVPQRDWVYRKQFKLDAALAGKRIWLVFKGVDYCGHFYLNGTLLGAHTGMYTPATFEVAHLLTDDGENTLAVAIEHAPQEEPQIGYTSRVRTHKGRMGYWWDFCPRIVHQGIWDDVYLEATGPVRVEDVFVRPQLAPDQRTAAVRVAVRVNALEAQPVQLSVTLSLGGQLAAELHSDLALLPGDSEHDVQLDIDQPALWWPNGSGQQPLYTAEVRVSAAGAESDRRSVSFGIRTLAFAPNEDPAGDALPYTLVVNGCKTYIKGWNWVPFDALFGPERPEKLRRLLTLAKRAHVNLLRVWGGGLIEKDAFYDLCDQYGILVWQEFIQSSSGLDNIPSEAPEFVDMLVREAEQIIPLKRNHPSLAVWCGGNELQAGPEQPLDDSHPTLAALKAVAQRLDPDRLWLATSPTGKVFSNSLNNINNNPLDLHDVHGPWEYQGAAGQCELFNAGSSLLHSEFGVEGITNLKTLNAVIPAEKQWPVSLDDNPYWFHLAAWWVRRTTWDAVFGTLPDVEQLVWATQYMQFDGLRYALEADRRRKYHNSGTLPWQFNEPYPMAACTSAVDYFGQPKPVYYAVAAAYRPMLVSARFPTLVWKDRADFEAEIWVNNSSAEASPNARLRVRLVGQSGKVFAELVESVTCGPNRAAQLAVFSAALAEVETVFFPRSPPGE